MSRGEDREFMNNSKEVSETLSSLMDKVLPWADVSEKLFKAFKKELYPYQDLAEEMPEGWMQACREQYVAGKVFGNPSSIKKFIRSAQLLLSRDEKNLVHHFMQNPWFYSVFSVEELVHKNLIKVFDHSKERSLTLISRGVFDLYRSGKRFFLSLLFNGGGAYQTYGPINYYQGFDLKDLECFASLSGRYFRQSGDLSLAIALNPVPFYMLYGFAEFPVSMRRNEKLVLCSHEIEAPDFTPQEYSESFDIEDKGGLFKLTLKNTGEPEFFSTVYFESKKGLLSIHSMGMKRYRKLMYLLGKEHSFPPEPSWCASMQMVVALEKVLGIKVPSHRYDEHFDDEADSASDEELVRLNALTGEITDRRNRGISYKVEEMAEKYDFPVETVRQVERIFEKLEKKYEIDIEGGFESFRPPPPEERMKMKGSFKENEFFKFNHSKKARAYFKRQVLPEIMDIPEALEYLDEENSAFSLSDLPYLIEDLYFPQMEASDFTILLYTMYLLWRKGDGYLKVRDYSVEVLRTFWQVILPSKGKRHIERFIKRYGSFCYAVLYRLGMVEIDQDPGAQDAKNAEYRIKASSFFREWIKF